jgi:hypothetical protein
MRILKTSLIALLIATYLVGCGGGSSESTAEPAPVATNTPQASTPIPATSIPEPTPVSTPAPVSAPVATPVLNAYAGNYVGTFSGLANGTFSALIGTDGNVTGSGLSTTTGNTFTLSGSVDTSGQTNLDATGTTLQTVFSGSINSAGVLTGTWRRKTLAAGAVDGNFSGTKQ